MVLAAVEEDDEDNEHHEEHKDHTERDRNLHSRFHSLAEIE